MTDTTGYMQSLADLLASSSDEIEFDWDTSPLADWPNIVPTSSFTAGLPATATEQPH